MVYRPPWPKIARTPMFNTAELNFVFFIKAAYCNFWRNLVTCINSV